MKQQTERFKKAYTALVNAYHNGTLAKGTCQACAVGNIVADAMGAKIFKGDFGYFDCDQDNGFWSDMFCSGMTVAFISNFKAEKLLKLTGYSYVELAKVEKAFEFNCRIEEDDYNIHSEQEILEDQFNGLSAVLDVLLELDDIQDSDNKLRADLQAHPSLKLINSK